MNKYKFKHSAKHLPETIGVSDERWDEIAGAARKAAMAAYLQDPEINDTGQMIELAMNSTLPQSAIEGFVLGWCLGRCSIMAEHLSEKLAKATKEQE